ncbi:MAG: demethoxyubiquinone hydroxylase family protein, partial [Hyphomonadaceae bacterium]|nr:demethoxyubiquinone hydroxylase family protein [Hyphomonadaceae bacterium]
MPGQTRDRRVEEMIRVDHAGEYGAVQIYKGQQAVFGPSSRTARTAQLIAEMEAGEAEHLQTFDRLIRERRVRPTALAPLWRLAGFGLGAATALMGEKAAHACTAAVEEVIQDHYAAQAEELGAAEPELKTLIERFREDEMGHRETALAEGAEGAPGYPLLRAVIKAGCRAAIRLS